MKKKPNKGWAQRIFCDLLGWHNGKGDTPKFGEGDVLGVNLMSRCSRCGKSVMQDGQGNWF